MTKYLKKSIVIEAFEFGEECYPDWFDKEKHIVHRPVILHENNPLKTEYLPVFCMIQTLEGAMKANEGDYIIKGIKGEIYPCRADIFKETYQEIEE